LLVACIVTILMAVGAAAATAGTIAILCLLAAVVTGHDNIVVELI